MWVKEKANLFLTSSFFKTVVIRYRVPLHACDRSICADWKISSKLLFHFISISIQFKAIFKVWAALSFLTLVERSSCLLKLCHGLPFLVFRTTRLFIQFYGVFLRQEFWLFLGARQAVFSWLPSHHRLLLIDLPDIYPVIIHRLFESQFLPL